ncbi:MAG: hypothetical protein Q8P01_00980 [bacterium]|nr:hypothetical protein [bacterium]
METTDVRFLPQGTKLPVQFRLPRSCRVDLILLGEPGSFGKERPARVWAGGFFLAEFFSLQERLVRGATEGWYDPPDKEDVCIGEGCGFRVRLGHNDDEGPIVYVYSASSRDQEGEQ